MPSAAEQDKVEGGGDYPDGECGILGKIYDKTFQLPQRWMKRLKIY